MGRMPLGSTLRMDSGNSLPVRDDFERVGMQFQQSRGVSSNGGSQARTPAALLCSQCGAPHDGRRCEYCGTRFAEPDVFDFPMSSYAPGTAGQVLGMKLEEAGRRGLLFGDVYRALQGAR